MGRAGPRHCAGEGLHRAAGVCAAPAGSDAALPARGRALSQVRDRRGTAHLSFTTRNGSMRFFAPEEYCGARPKSPRACASATRLRSPEAAEGSGTHPREHREPACSDTGDGCCCRSVEPAAFLRVISRTGRTDVYSLARHGSNRAGETAAGGKPVETCSGCWILRRLSSSRHIRTRVQAARRIDASRISVAGAQQRPPGGLSPVRWVPPRLGLAACRADVGGSKVKTRLKAMDSWRFR
jgi:hypothetical protein